MQWVVQDLGDAFPGIESQPQVCGGEARTWIPELNILGVVVIYLLGVTGTEVDLRATDSYLAMLAQVLVAAGQLLISLSNSRVFYRAAKGTAMIGKSYSAG